MQCDANNTSVLMTDFLTCHGRYTVSCVKSVTLTCRCLCGYCSIMPTSAECVCCREISAVLAEMDHYHQSDPHHLNCFPTDWVSLGSNCKDLAWKFQSLMSLQNHSLNQYHSLCIRHSPTNLKVCYRYAVFIQAIRERNIAYHIHSHLIIFIQLYTSSCGSYNS